MFGPLGDHGGPTRTHALLEGSPAIDAAPTSTFTVDQRYVTRPQGHTRDIGAFEFSDFPAVSLAIDPSGLVNQSTGVGVVTGTMTCSKATTVELEVGLSQTQKAGKVNTTVHGTATSTVSCDGFRYWSAVVAPVSGAFKNNTASATAVTLNVLGTPWVTPGSAAHPVKLTWSKK